MRRLGPDRLCAAAASQFIVNLPTFFNKWKPAPEGFAVPLMDRAAKELGRDHLISFELGNEPRYCGWQTPPRRQSGAAVRGRQT